MTILQDDQKTGIIPELAEEFSFFPLGGDSGKGFPAFALGYRESWEEQTLDSPVRKSDIRNPVLRAEVKEGE